MNDEERVAHNVIIKDLQNTIFDLQKWKDEQIVVYKDISREATEYRNEVIVLKNRLKDRTDEYEYQLEEKNRLLRNGVDEILKLKTELEKK